MKVAMSIAGRGATIYLVQQLFKRGYLSKLITSYPKFEIKKYGIPPDLVDSIVIKEVIERGWRKLPGFIRNVYNPSFLVQEIFDKSAAKRLEPSDIIWIWTASALHTIRRARELGIKTVVEVGNAHPIYQEKILTEEYEKNGQVFRDKNQPKLLEKMLNEYDETDYISVPSSYVRQTFIEAGVPKKKIIQIPYGADLSEFKQFPKEDDVFRVVFAGGMTIRKGVHYLLQAFSELNLPNSELLLIGAMNDEIKPFFKKYEGHFKYAGFLPKNQLSRSYSQGSVFALDSLDDGFGIVIMQAMACGLPLICSTNTGAPDVIEDGKEGFIIPIRNLEALKNKLLFLYKNQKLCREMGQAAKQRVASGFTWDHYGDRIVEEFKRILRTQGVQS